MDALTPRERLLGPALRTQPDRRLVALARGGSVAAEEEIVRRYRAALVRYAGAIVGVAAAEDVVQEALTKGLAALGRADGELRLRPWLYAIVRNTALNQLRDAGPATEQLDQNYDGVEQPPQALERREQVSALVGGLRLLPRQQRQALVKRELEGRSHEQIGAELGVSSGAARQLIFRAREALRVGFGSLLPMPLLRHLAAEGGGEAAVGVGAAGGGALAAKAAMAVFAAGAAVTAGVAIDHGAKQRSAGVPTAEPAAVRPAALAPAPGAAAPLQPVVATASEERKPGGGSLSSGRERGEGSVPDSAEKQAGADKRGGRAGGDSGDGSGPGPSEHPASGASGSGSAGTDGSGGEDRSGSSHDDRGSGGSGEDSGGSAGRTSHGDGGASGDESGSGSSSGGNTGPGAGSGFAASHDGSGSGASADSGEAFAVTPSPSPTPTSDSGSAPIPAPDPAIEGSSSGSGSSGSGGSETSSEDSRDLSAGSVSQGSDDPD